MRNLCMYFSRICLSFSLGDPVIRYFAIINLCHEYNYMVSPVNPFSKLLKVQVVLRNSGTVRKAESKTNDFFESEIPKRFNKHIADREKVLLLNMTDKRVIFIVYKEFIQTNKKKRNVSRNMGQQ